MRTFTTIFTAQTGQYQCGGTRVKTGCPYRRPFTRHAPDLGFPEDGDMNHPEATGVGAFPLNNPGGIRMSTALTYLNACRYRLNLTIRANARALRVIFQGTHATGIEVESGDEVFAVEGEEIILCGGAIASPQLLMLSGVGPGEQLKELGIETVRELPGVGQNMKNHPSVSLRYRLVEGNRPPADAPRNQVGLRFTAEGSAYRNDIQVQPTTSYPEGPVTPDIRIGCRLELPISQGELTLTSRDVSEQPRLEYRFLTDSQDRDRLRSAIRQCAEIFRHPAFDGLLGERVAPTDEALADDAALDLWMQRDAGIAGHTSVTCRMGLASDPMAVVDQYCRVHGLQGLRVVDASIMPEITRANTNATTIMMAERAADLIREGD